MFLCCFFSSLDPSNTGSSIGKNVFCSSVTRYDIKRDTQRVCAPTREEQVEDAKE